MRDLMRFTSLNTGLGTVEPAEREFALDSAEAPMASCSIARPGPAKQLRASSLLVARRAPVLALRLYLHCVSSIDLGPNVLTNGRHAGIASDVPRETAGSYNALPFAPTG